MITEGPSGKAQRELRAELAEEIDKLLDERRGWYEIRTREAGRILEIESLRPRLRALVLGEDVDKPPQDWALSAGDCNDE